MLKACVLDFRGSWDVHLPLVEFSYNNSYHSSVRCAPFEVMKSIVRKLLRKAEFTEVESENGVLIAIVKVPWISKCGPEFTWEHEHQIKLKYP
ncbi:putative reverse transcriptase domain-containing protein [Tanacetum coccineum]|uniref:Reverse transcriptase domain-containing protein n=1 Tax=Tanacetum coccineum TaxID=301880 RepID=A0ABQ4ZNS9_9ASTR